MKIKYYKNNKLTYMCSNIFGKSQNFDFYTNCLWTSYSNNYKTLLEFKEKKSNNTKTIIINDTNFNRNSFKSNYLRKVLHLNQKDKDKFIYLVVLPTKKYFKSRLIQKCFQKSRSLFNKKYFFLDNYTHRLLLFQCLVQEEFYLHGS